ncbi:glutamyl-Q tRNA(Asp) synthetase [Aliiroseovarius halocynthiae]|uniref:tRNA glutamyl-Q(34) synthetase GluQRS n=1 Tax=Aliiroseovarius halocynthiae TaxID=985055 RepID=A0A545SVU3_9RHOB|nr:tRNA glutamyl-Q(34) synthetase GluQRS [Aliiroseovarius halocynthiae]TQV69090.1 tRNA glutamyl-Q(34) synthetase GluQRS [Aliiroseovarius halocynthiae]SMR71847.1 glutamyl-Q tRNA(Asp) synthetase [Aliiroseovarius halocynthiae]
MTDFITRFAPSPTGPLHLGHAYSALLAHDMARAAGGTFLLRIEDIDRTRSRLHWEDQIYDDLAWLGISWDEKPMRQSDRLSEYKLALHDLWNRALLYPCFCTRRDISAAVSAPQEGAEPAFGPDGLIYSGTCREQYIRSSSFPKHDALRLDMQDALSAADQPEFCYTEHSSGTDQTHCTPAKSMVHDVGDIVLSRRDFLGSYHLSVVLDDAAQGISHVVRGKDIQPATPIHVLLQKLLGLPTPTYHHHRLIRDENGKRLAKRDDARAIATYRAEGKTPDDIRRMVGL